MAGLRQHRRQAVTADRVGRDQPDAKAHVRATPRRTLRLSASGGVAPNLANGSEALVGELLPNLPPTVTLLTPANGATYSAKISLSKFSCITPVGAKQRSHPR